MTTPDTAPKLQAAASILISTAGRSFRCSLHGAVPPAGLQKLLERLVGVCGDMAFDGDENLVEHEIVFVPAVESPFGPARNDDVVVRLRAPVFEDGAFRALRDRKWCLCQLGPPEPPKGGRPTFNNRAVYESAIVGDAFKFVELLGYR
ncbi:hypothetical protein BDK51DRAFT_16256 [Blyttiomyces helicus]|uniref:Uncharacterized protein n=1 Tax=Blyttiomyces helicus TaxID=388810 RepID=A0A4V1IQI4_9FUNG|nr:hypothetical protein BDK51DRAFT_16256 [Blyttiomyces helicus]|eukprot:RKO86667.1 hypothetical protein BDK51DRAFT_16256 [Blyttiomyces helicus]